MHRSGRKSFAERIESNKVNIDEEDEFLLEGYTSSVLRFSGLVLLEILSAGILFFITSWRPTIKVRIANCRCSLEQAQILILRDQHGHEYIEKVYTSPQNRSFAFRYFYHKKLKYIWKSEYKHFIKLRGLDLERCSQIYSQAEGATTSEAAFKLDLFERNSIEIELQPIWKLVLDEITGPFYLYQFFICAIWLIQLYYQFAFCILLLSILSVATHVWQTRKQTIALRQQVQSASQVTVLRDQSPMEVCSTQLVPGDVLILPRHGSSLMMECDAVLMTGSCVVDESMLTGESVPVPKVALVENSNVVYSASVHKSNTLFSGTRILTVLSSNEDELVKAVVIRTGFSTTKGELARSILFPSKENDNLKKQLIKMCAIFFVIGLPCMAYTVYALARFNFPKQDIFIIVLDVATFLIPPMLPAVLTSVNVHAQRRLKTKGIYCLSPRKINCCGEVDVMCFDKTGTLTEDTIDFAGLITIEDESFGPVISEPARMGREMVVKAMACCHSLVEYEGHVEGDDLDLKLFSASGWLIGSSKTNSHFAFDKTSQRMVVNPNDNSSIAILKQFPFESFLQRMLVIVHDAALGQNLAILKGAPEVVTSFCRTDTIPKDFEQVFESYTRKGFRVIASAVKVIDSVEVDNCCDLTRSEVECEMEFLGLYLFKNKLKRVTAHVLRQLSEANIRCVMATGDNLLTAINIAEECGLVGADEAIIKVRAFQDKSGPLRLQYNYAKYPSFVFVNNNNTLVERGDLPEDGHLDYHIAIDGESYSTIKAKDPNLLNRVVHRGTIFARMSPDQKLSLVNTLKRQDHSVGMCGDGANDCGALRAADAGIALSVAEASVASPFTYKHKDIVCVPSLLKEGRCTLVSIFGAFKYQVCYCFILLGAVLVLFWHGTKPSDGTYVFVDIVLNILPPIMFATTEPYHKLVPRMPLRNMLSVIPQTSMYSFIIIQVLVYYYVQHWLTTQSWYQPVRINIVDIHDPAPCHLSYAVFAVNMMSYVIAAIIFAQGPPYRANFFSNKKYIAMVAINFILSTCIILTPPEFLLNFLKFEAMPFDFRLKLFGISLVNFVVCLLWEKVLLDQVLRKLIDVFKNKFRIRSNKQFIAIEEQIVADEWPLDQLVSCHKAETTTLKPDATYPKQLTRAVSEDNLM